MLSAGGKGEDSLPVPDTHKAVRAFLTLQEQAIRAGVVDGFLEAIPVLRAMVLADPTVKRFSHLSSRSRQRAALILLAYVKHAVPVPRGPTVAIGIGITGAPATAPFNREAYQRLLSDPLTREAAMSLLEHLEPAPPEKVVDVEPEPPAS